MEQSELSKIVATLKIAFPSYFKELTSLDIVGMVNLYANQLEGYTFDVVNKAVDNLIGKLKYMPSISEIKDECALCIREYESALLKKMFDDGYFHKGFKELDDIHALRNYEKANMWVSRGIIPEWLLKDMMQYGYKPMLNKPQQKLLGE